MNDSPGRLSHREAIEVAVRREALYDVVSGVTELTGTWDFLPRGLEMFHDKYGTHAEDEIATRTEQAHTGIPRTLAAIERIVEGPRAHQEAIG